MPQGKKSDKCFTAIGLSIKRLRTERGLSQNKLAELADIHPTYIGQIERGLKRPSLTVFFRIADGLTVRPAELFEGINRGKTG